MAKSVKKGDEVIVIAGDHKNKKGKVLQVFRDKNRVIVEGVNMIKKHERKTQDNPQGSIIEREVLHSLLERKVSRVGKVVLF